ncbi:hypothetical protein V2H45_02160 [Tumidithrix elongata RA019]|uniref:DRBM domain-containing protein n=1 Tax=Tumidithrix elongata BACA0141 TaxID=2716417 RepID=A0AAW9PX65_9CYAN|nr:hypothetical protein [Tumidithrix elongata RA019]
MFAQFRTQYPQGSIKTKMLPKVDGLHVFRATILHGEITLGTATAADTDIEVAEDRAIKRALMIAGITFDGNYGMKATLIGQSTNINALPSSSINSEFVSFAGNQQAVNTLATNHANSSPQPNYPSEFQSYQNNHQDTTYPDNDSYPSSYQPNYPNSEPTYEEPKPTKTAAIPEFTAEPVDLSDAISKIDVEMERLSWTKNQGRDYLLQTFNKRSRQQLTAAEMMQFLSHLKSLPTLPQH